MALDNYDGLAAPQLSLEFVHGLVSLDSMFLRSG